ncbi:Crp/Fnr family transcriptional regulator [Abyssalbus ytuae]|uniref:Cyclic nucleotide-binding domain-containing protein n=1 Tax=Abyssalbus ytuae TaxID=2926907 RepID=A0A9E6ZYC1_9FLAO|nr:cyclic nucleotide-binding domain-containing protein [Abyssalbus ytuae]UOB16146.1 cyclic nucleotide-binding domain-containing protein [Abyssalbus ytuae]
MNRFDYFNLFHKIDRKEYNLIIKNLKKKNFNKGETIVVPGETQKNMYFVNSGVQMSFFESQKKTHVIAFTYPPDLCAIPESFTQQKPSKYFLTCLSDSHLEYLTYDDLQEIFDKSQNIERLFRKMTELLVAGIINRHIELHSLTIEERFKAFCTRSPHLLQLVPHKHIASYLSINPTNFSKLFNSIKI